MEQALFISRFSNSQYLTDDFTRLYFGQEFCERLLPEESQLASAIALADERNLDFTLVTPYVTCAGLARVERLVALLAARRPEAELVFNDWGVFHLVRHEFPQLKPVMGRLLNKMKRGPRIMNIFEKIPGASQDYFRTPGLDAPALVDFLITSGIGRVEFDNVLQGIRLDGVDRRIKRSLYLPFAFVSTTRFCLSANCDKPEYADRIGIFPCGRECQRYTFHLFNPVMTLPLIRKGNTIFFLNETIPDVVAKQEVDRLVIQPEIPL